MGLSQTNKTESACESFYGTNLAGREVAMLEMNEEQVCIFCSSMGAVQCTQYCKVIDDDLLNTPSFTIQMPSQNAYRYIKDERKSDQLQPAHPPTYSKQPEY